MTFHWAQVLRQAPPRCVLTTESPNIIQLSNGAEVATAPLRDALLAALHKQIASGRQVGMAVVVYWRGEVRPPTQLDLMQIHR